MTRSSAVIDSSLYQIRLFLIDGLARSLSEHVGPFEPQEDWRLVVENVAKIRAIDHQLPSAQKAALDELIGILEHDLNAIVSILREVVERRGYGSAAERELVTTYNVALLKVRDDFERSARAFYKLRPAKEQSGVVQFFLTGGEIHMGDVFQGISNSTIVSKSTLEGAFNRLRDSGNGESAKLLVEIGKRVSNANDAAAGAVYSQMAEELSKPAHDKSILKSCWDGLVKLLPPLANLSAEVIKAFSI